MIDFDDLVEELQQKRDELRVQLNLASREMRDEWDELEEKLGELTEKARQFAAEANISSPAQIDGKWTMANKTFDEWFAARMAGTTRHRFREPVNEFTVHVDDGLAFVRADANYIVDGEVRSNNIDYFTLIRVDGVWKFVNASYVTKAPAHE